MMVQFELTQSWRSPLLLRGALPAALCRHWLARSHALSAAPTASQPSCLARKVLDLGEVLQAVAASPLRAPIAAALGAQARCNLSESWLRHGRPAHHWHQDGALGFDFIAHTTTSAPHDALLDMLTCWIALTPCGADAPGLEWVDSPCSQLLWPADLTPSAVQTRHAADNFVRPVMDVGDALLFDGHLLHRTHLTPEMRSPRTSLELRFFRAAAWPTRLADDEGLALPGA